MNKSGLKFMPIQQIKPRQGRLLISEPFLNDPFFKRSVIFLTEHDEKGSVGFILNKPIDLQLNEAIKGFPYFETQLGIGGPVGRDSLHYIHTLGDKIDKSVEVADGLFWGGNFETVKRIIQEGEAYPSDIRFFVGYSGWEPKQLDKELSQNNWFVVPSNLKYILNSGYSDRNLWREILKDLGTEYAILANFPEDPSFN